MTSTGKMNSNGKRVFGRGVDKRISGSKKVNRYIREFIAALGGETRLNVGEIHTIRRLAALTVLAERQEGWLVTNSPKYCADEHMRNVGKIKLITDDLDFPKKRRPRRSAPDPDDPEYEDDDPNAETFEEFLEDEAKKPSFGKAISAASVCATETKQKRKRSHLH